MSLKVLVIAPDYPYPVIGGLQKQAHELSRELSQLGCDILVLSGKHDAAGPSSELVDGIQVKRAPWIDHHRGRLVCNALWAVLQILFRGNRFDVIHVHNLSLIGVVSAVAGWLTRTSVMMKLPASGPSGIPGLRAYPFGRGVIFMLKAVSAFVAMSHESVEELNEISTPKRKVFKVMNGINLQQFDETAGGDETSNTSNSPLKVVFTGRIVARKGVADLLLAWKRLSETNRLGDSILEIVGEGEDEPRLRGLVAEYGIEASVKFLGYRSDVPSLLVEADVFMLPSYAEGNSNSIIEAMAAKLPIVSTDVGGSAMLVGEEGGRWIVTAGDADEMVRCLSEMIESTALREEVGDRMRQRVEDYFDIKVVAADYLRAYRALAVDRRADMEPLASNAFVNSKAL